MYIGNTYTIPFCRFHAYHPIWLCFTLFMLLANGPISPKTTINPISQEKGAIHTNADMHDRLPIMGEWAPEQHNNSPITNMYCIDHLLLMWGGCMLMLLLLLKVLLFLLWYYCQAELCNSVYTRYTLSIHVKRLSVLYICC